GNAVEVRITCEFDELPERIVLDDQFETTLADEFLLQSNGRLRISKIYDCSKAKISAPAIFINASHHPVDETGKSLLPLTLPELKKLAEAKDVKLEPGEATVK